MINTFIKFPLAFCFLLLACMANAQVPGNERQATRLTDTNYLDGGDLCPNNYSAKFHHHIVLIDSTSPLREDQIDWVRRMLFSEGALSEMAPWDRLTIMRLGGVQPSSNKPLFSKCRPRNGSEQGHAIDKANIYRENKSMLERVYNQLFVDEIEKTLLKIKNNEYDQPPTINNSPILEQIKEISRLRDLDFGSDSGYETRRLTIVSDLTQNSERLPFYDVCPGNRKCPSWEVFKNDKKYRLWAQAIEPKFGKGMDVRLMYLNTFFDSNLTKNILPFWEAYFSDNKIKLDGFDIESMSTVAN